jgi:hypothetical protein
MSSHGKISHIRHVGVWAVTDAVGEFPYAADHPNSELNGALGGRETRFPNGTDEFANGISNGIENRHKRRIKVTVHGQSVTGVQSAFRLEKGFRRSCRDSLRPALGLPS